LLPFILDHSLVLGGNQMLQIRTKIETHLLAVYRSDQYSFPFFTMTPPSITHRDRHRPEYRTDKIELTAAESPRNAHAETTAHFASFCNQLIILFLPSAVHLTQFCDRTRQNCDRTVVSACALRDFCLSACVSDSCTTSPYLVRAKRRKRRFHI